MSTHPPTSSTITQRIVIVRGQRVLLDSDLAALYEVETKRLIEAVRRNLAQFPAGFTFQLTPDEWASLRSKLATLEAAPAGRSRHRKHPPYAFTGPGAIMAANFMSGPGASDVSAYMARAFGHMRDLTASDGELTKRRAEMAGNTDPPPVSLDRSSCTPRYQLKHALDVLRALMTAPDPVQLSKFLSFVLRHKPDAIGLTLDPQGWADIDELIERAHAAGTPFSHDDLRLVVETSDKKRFSISTDGLRIRAAQGHSVAIELGLSPEQPPPVLYHGTATRFVESILHKGLTPQARQQVHLSTDEATARNVGQRHGKPTIFKIDALRMHEKGFKFYRADNGVWLTDQVPPEFLVPTSSVTDSATTSIQPKQSR